MSKSALSKQQSSKHSTISNQPSKCGKSATQVPENEKMDCCDNTINQMNNMVKKMNQILPTFNRYIAEYHLAHPPIPVEDEYDYDSEEEDPCYVAELRPPVNVKRLIARLAAEEEAKRDLYQVGVQVKEDSPNKEFCKPLCDLTCDKIPKKTTMPKIEASKKFGKYMSDSLKAMQSDKEYSEKLCLAKIPEGQILPVHVNERGVRTRKCVKDRPDLTSTMCRDHADGRKITKKVFGLDQLKRFFPLLALLDKDKFASITPEDLLSYVHAAQFGQHWTLDQAIYVVEEWKSGRRDISVEEVLFAVQNPERYIQLLILIQPPPPPPPPKCGGLKPQPPPVKQPPQTNSNEDVTPTPHKCPSKCGKKNKPLNVLDLAVQDWSGFFKVKGGGYARRPTEPKINVGKCGRVKEERRESHFDSTKRRCSSASITKLYSTRNKLGRRDEKAIYGQYQSLIKNMDQTKYLNDKHRNSPYHCNRDFSNMKRIFQMASKVGRVFADRPIYPSVYEPVAECCRMVDHTKPVQMKENLHSNWTYNKQGYFKTTKAEGNISLGSHPYIFVTVPKK